MRRSASYRDAVAWTSPDTCSHLSLTNGRGQHQGDLPRLLRRMATEIAKLGPDTMILDFVVHDEVDDLGSFFTATWRTGRRAVADDDDLHAVVRHRYNRGTDRACSPGSGRIQGYRDPRPTPRSSWSRVEVVDVSESLGYLQSLFPTLGSLASAVA